MSAVLIVEPDGALRETLAGFLRASGWRADAVADAESARELEAGTHTAVLVDLATPACVDAIAALRRREPGAVVIAMGSRDRLGIAVQALRHGARDVLLKPFDVATLERALAAATLRRSAGPSPEHALPSADPAMRAVVRGAEAAARSDVTLQIVGEPGSGKRRLARFVHAASARRAGPFVEWDCTAAAREAIPSASATGGTLALVEPGALAPPLQRAALALLEERVLDAGRREPDVRVVALARRPLRDDGRLLPALRLRLDVVVLVIPPLRERPADLVPLAEELAARIARAEGLPSPKLGARALEALRAHPFPGNVRELENLMRRAVLCGTGRELELEPLLGPRPTPPPPVAASLNLRELERDAIARALALHGGNRTHAARALGISVRTLRNKIREFGDGGHRSAPARAGADRSGC